MDIGHVVWVLIFLILLVVFCNGYVGEYMVAVVWIWTATAKKITECSQKLTVKPLAHGLPFVSLYVFMFACMSEWMHARKGLYEASAITVASPILQHPFNLASQGCNKRVKWEEGKRGGSGVGHKVDWRGWVQGGGYRGTDGSSGSGLFWATSWKQTHITNMLLCSGICFPLIITLVCGSNVQGARTLCHSPALASRSEIINTVLRYFLFFLQRRFTSDTKKKKKHGSKSRSDKKKGNQNRQSLINSMDLSFLIHILGDNTATGNST